MTDPQADARNSMPAIIQLRKLTKVYRQGHLEVPALQALDLELQKGEFAALCGPSGSGKTTCLNIVGALDRSSSGETWVDGKHLEAMTRTELSHLRRDRIGFVFQAYNLIPVLTAYENTEFILALQGRPVPERRERCLGLLRAVGLEGLEDRRPDELSGGQQQRVAIARAIAHDPAVVLADEPTANLDSTNAESLLDLMEQLNRTRGITFLFSTHDARVMKRARRLLILKDGRLDKDEAGAKE
jgi:putative ABC transport system ATP-binding protein